MILASLFVELWTDNFYNNRKKAFEIDKLYNLCIHLKRFKQDLSTFDQP